MDLRVLTCASATVYILRTRTHSVTKYFQIVKQRGVEGREILHSSLRERERESQRDGEGE